MLHAVIRSAASTVHFFSEVNRYNLQTLRRYVKDVAHEEGTVHLSMQLDEHEKEPFRRHTKKWLAPQPDDLGRLEAVVPAF